MEKEAVPDLQDFLPLLGSSSYILSYSIFIPTPIIIGVE